MSKTIMKLPADTAGISIRGVELTVTNDDVHGLVAEVPDNLVDEARENGLISVKAILDDAELAAAEQRVAEEKAAEEARIKAEAEAEEKRKKEEAERLAEEAKIIKAGDTVSFEEDGNKLEGVVKEIRTVKKEQVADVIVTLPGADPEEWEVALSALTKVFKE